MEILTALLPAITTIAGAAIGATVSYLVSRYQFRATVLSGNRQNWINDLREALTEYETIMHDICAEFRARNVLRSTEDRLAAILRANLLVTRIKLLINPSEKDHAELLSIMDKMRTCVTRASEEQRPGEFAELDNRFVALAQTILKREWERVKAGR